jgi:hypothetical protein
MKTFNSPEEFAMYFGRQTVGLTAKMSSALGAAGTLIRDDARRRLGQYQSGDAVFPKWEQLAPDTQTERARRGFSQNRPLLRSSALRRAIEREVVPMGVLIGVKSGPGPEYDPQRDIGDIARRMEFGTVTAPPRPFLGPAVLATWEKVAVVLGQRLKSILSGSSSLAGFGLEGIEAMAEVGVRRQLLFDFTENMLKRGYS